MKNILQKIKLNPDYLALVIVMLALVISNSIYRLWNDPNHIVVDDVVLYYEYLPAVLIYNDLSMSFTGKDPEFFRNKVWTHDTPKGRTISKMTMGMAVLYSPFILVSHGLAGPLGYPADGYSMPYRIALVISSVCYALAGLFFLMFFLRRYFARPAVAMTILTIGAGTNLYFYTTIDPAMSHAYSFFLFALFIFLLDKWTGDRRWIDTVLLGLTGGLIILVRPSNIIIFMLIFIWKIDSLPALQTRLKILLREPLKILTIGFATFLVFLPQLLYWNYSTGQFFYYSYGQERFFFNDPEFLKGLFSYRKGWLVYTPVMVFALAGFAMVYRHQRKLFWPVLIFTFVNMYILWSWWCWWYGGGFGQRALIESYVLLSVPFAAFVSFVIQKKTVWKTAFFSLLILFITLNVFQTFQYSKGIIHWDSMTKKAYWDTYIRTKTSPAHYEQLEAPDYQAAMKGDR